MPLKKSSIIPLFQSTPYLSQCNLFLHSQQFPGWGLKVRHAAEDRYKKPKSWNIHKPSCLAMKIQVSKAGNLQTTCKTIHQISGMNTVRSFSHSHHIFMTSLTIYLKYLRFFPSSNICSLYSPTFSREDHRISKAWAFKAAQKPSLRSARFWLTTKAEFQWMLTHDPSRVKETSATHHQVSVLCTSQLLLPVDCFKACFEVNYKV